MEKSITISRIKSYDYILDVRLLNNIGSVLSCFVKKVILFYMYYKFIEIAYDIWKVKVEKRIDIADKKTLKALKRQLI